MNPTRHRARDAVTTNRPWTPDDDAIMRTEYPHAPLDELAARLDRARTALHKRAEKLGLKRPHRMPAGFRPKNYAPVGATRKQGRQGYTFIKVAEGGWPQAWRPLHHVLWEQAHGKIPPDHLVTFKDGNVEHIELDNLELVARADWIARFIPERLLPPELAGIIRVKAALTRAINQLAKEQSE